jgi:hypothetical protein
MTSVKWIVLGIVGLVAWLQYNTDFKTTSQVLIVLAVFIALVLGAGLNRMAVRGANDDLIRFQEAQSSMRREEIRLMRTEQQGMNVMNRHAVTLAKQMVSQMLPYHKAQIEAKYAAAQPVAEQEEGVPVMQYDEDDL